jgi:hypothetical protein
MQHKLAKAAFNAREMLHKFSVESSKSSTSKQKEEAKAKAFQVSESSFQGGSCWLNAR